MLEELTFDDAGGMAVGLAAMVNKRLGLCGDLLQLRDVADKAQAEAESVAQKANVTAMVARKAGAIRRMLVPSWRGGADASPADVLLSASTSRQALADAIEDAKHAPPHEQVAAGLMVAELMKMVRDVEAGEAMMGLRKTLPGFPTEIGAGAAELAYPKDADASVPPWAANYGFAKAIVDDAAKRGAFPEGLQQQMAEVVAAAANAQLPHDKDIDPEAYAKWKEMHDAHDEWAVRLKAAGAKYGEFPVGSQERADAQDAYADLYKEYQAYRSTYEEAGASIRARRSEEWKRLQSVVAEAGRPILDAAMADSDVEEGAANDWASRQEITPQAVARLKRIGYPVEQVRRDMAEFYRFVRGRIEKVRIHSKGDRRANATDVGGHGKPGSINIGTSFDKRVLWHELGHHVEADPAAASAARLYIRMRAESGANHRLRDLTGSTGYGPKEVALKDGYFSEYVGKVYSHGTTEVFSMGIETFSDPALLARRIAVDPQTLEFVLGYLKSPKTVIGAMHLAMRQSLRQTSEDAKEDAEAGNAERIKGLAARSGFVADTNMAWAEGKKYEWLLTYGGDKQVGRCTFDGRTVWVYESTLKNPETGRRGKAYVLKMTEDDVGYVESVNCYTKDMDVVKAMGFLWCRDGVQPSYYKVIRGDFSV